MSEQVRISPDDEVWEWKTYVIPNYGGLGLELWEGPDPAKINNFYLTDDELLIVAIAHPAVKKLVQWAKATIEHVNMKFEDAWVWTEGKEALKPFEEEK